ncbi:hypothetical protein AMTRI_Chr09g12180 [Amborella trichopoda]
MGSGAANPDYESREHQEGRANASANEEDIRTQFPPLDSIEDVLLQLEDYTSGSVPKEQANWFLQTVATFITSCSVEQIRLAPDKFISLCKRFKDQVLQLQAPMQGIAPMRTAIRKLQSSAEHLTSLHSDFLLLCIVAKCYKAGLSIMEDDIFEVDQPKDFFLYCYYGGILNIGQKRFRKALEYLHHAITAPMTVLNTVAVEAYKKYILVSLIHTGQAYIDLANSYATGKISEVEKCLETHVDKFKLDVNLGLVKQVVLSLYKRNIQRLTQTYLTLSLQDIASTVQLETSKQAELHVLQMIHGGEIFASINQKDGMVSFHEDPEQYKTSEMIEHIDSSIRRIMLLSKKLSAVDEHISCDAAYLSKVGRERPRFEIDEFDTVPQKYMTM